MKPIMGFMKAKKNATDLSDNVAQLDENTNANSHTLGFLNGLNSLRTRTVLEVNGFYAVDDGASGKYRVLTVSGSETWQDIKNSSNVTIFQLSTAGEVRAVGGTKKLKVIPKDGVRNVRLFGAKGDGIQDDTTAILTARLFGASNGFSLYFPDGTYIINDMISLKNKNCYGESRAGTVIKSICTDPTKPIFALGGTGRLSTMTITYSQTISTLNDQEYVGIRLNDSTPERFVKGASISNILITNVGTAISDNGLGCFNVNFENLAIAEFSYLAVHLSGTTRTGNVWKNIYISSSKNTIRGGIIFEGEESELVMDQINLEHFSGGTAMVFNNVFGFKIGSLHIEGTRVKNTWSGYIDLTNSSGTIDTASFYYTRQELTGVHLFRLRSGKAVVSGQTTTYVNGDSMLKIGTLVCKGLNRPDAGSYPTVLDTQKTLNNAPSFNFFFRDTGFDLTQDNYFVQVDHYKWETWNTVISDDSSIYNSFPCDPNNMITFVKKGQLPVSGTTANRPTNRRVKGVTQYFDTSLNKLITWDGSAWRDGTGAVV